MAGTDGQQVRPEPIERGEKVRPARFGAPEDGHHRRDADRDAKRCQATPQPPCAQPGRTDPGKIEQPDAPPGVSLDGGAGRRHDCTRSVATGPESRSIRPSRMSIRRGNMAATSRSWVMTP